MSDLTGALTDYLSLRRSLGYKLERGGRVLSEFVDYLEATGAETVTVEAAVAWATLTPNPESSWRAQRLGLVRGFARYLHVTVDQRHQIPPAGLIPRGRGRPAPCLFSHDDVARLMAAARTLSSPLRAATAETFIGLLAVSGLRVAEGIRLDADDVDVDSGVLAVRNSKAGKSRDVPLHDSTSNALSIYAALRDRTFPRPMQPSFFVSTTGTRLRSSNLGALFGGLATQAALSPHPVPQGRPRLGDLRHSFAVQTLTDWHTAGVDVEPRLPLLSTYMGHARPASTYWYLSASPELLASAAARLQPIGVSS
ncbi:MAG TPA: hypothetical protein ENH00_09620 [Actinobacteria bacterium]|nr:tyrosine recombinase XerC [bacterium BMS3Bbin01]HDH26436.1 hypothetical protein [Actinomycetota bacterium]